MRYLILDTTKSQIDGQHTILSEKHSKISLRRAFDLFVIFFTFVLYIIDKLVGIDLFYNDHVNWD